MGAPVLVAGLGTSGRAAAATLRKVGALVTTYDDRAEDADRHHPDEVDPTAFRLVVTSPGLPPHHRLLAAAAGRVEVVSEVELAWRLRVDRGDGRGPAPWLAVTGTNGKTTTVGMLAAILEAAGERVALVGNVGTPVVEAAVDPAWDVLAVELSSFQLHFTTSLAVEAGAVLNVAPDHLDWHGSMAEYAADKARIWHGAETVVYDVDDPATVQLALDRGLRTARERLQHHQHLVASGVRPQQSTGFTLGSPDCGEYGVVDGALVAAASEELIEIARVADLAHLVGPGQQVPPHLVADALAAAALALAHHGVGSVHDGPSFAHVRAGLRAYRPSGHRIATVAQLGEVSFVDDSKATNAHAAAASLAGFAAGSVVWVAGGLAKGATFDELVAAQADRLRAVVLIGTDRSPWRGALARHAPQVPVIEVDDSETGTVMPRAVAAAHRMASDPALGSGPVVVLLAPASASMDQFASYADRGDRFAQAARALAHQT
ncbi:MAG: UDP-N-acetylmuramoyl-L-alanine--D-glutamate ligase [Micrococcales bacterium]|nr:UDP-N-acetylmuramoyl-L-alanine--D-glutamate ligase [Micrococcales bacterium]